MKFCFFLLLPLTIASCFSNNKPIERQPNQVRNRYYVFLVHGLAGGKDTFGSLSTVLSEHLDKYNSNYENKVISVEYPTGKSNAFSQFDFVNYLNKQMLAAFSGRSISPSDKFAIIAHSQGGLVTLLWYIRSLKENSTESHRLAQNFDAFISLGSPFWGSGVASFIHYQLVQRIDVNFVNGSRLTTPKMGNTLINRIRLATGMGPTELKELRFGSDTIYFLRRTLIAFDKTADKRENIPRVANVVGLLPKSFRPANKLSLAGNLFVKVYGEELGGGILRPETDLVVTAPSAHVDFIYGEALNKYYQEGSNLPFEAFKETRLNHGLSQFPTYFVTSPHTTIANRLWTENISQVPISCTAIGLCEHKPYKIALTTILDCKNRLCPDGIYDPDDNLSPVRTDDLYTFSLDINLNLPVEYEIKPEFRRNNGIDHAVRFATSVRDSFTISVGRSMELFSKSYTDQELFNSPNPSKYLRLSAIGVIEAKPGHDQLYKNQRSIGFPLRMTIKLPGLKARAVEAKVRPGYSTFVDVTLER
jgi:hypothetical protein